MSRGFPIDFTPSLTLLATFLIDLIINLALFFDGGLDLGFPLDGDLDLGFPFVLDG
jgi:hypothetical protein